MYRPDANPVEPTLARSYPRGTRLGLHAHREAQLLFSMSGLMQVATPRGLWLLPPARAAWLPAGIEHSVDVLADIEMRALLIPPALLDSHGQAARLDQEFVVAVRPLLRQVILSLFEPCSDSRRTELLLELALHELPEAEDGATFMPLPTEPRARRVAELVLSRPDDDWSLEALAARVGLSARTLTRLFPAQTRLTFKAWRQRARVVTTLGLLGNGMPIKQVAARLGFSSTAAFGHAFRQIVGITPGDMKRRIEQGQA